MQTQQKIRFTGKHLKKKGLYLVVAEARGEREVTKNGKCCYTKDTLISLAPLIQP